MAAYERASLELIGVGKSIGGTSVLSDISLRVDRGTIAWVAGRNGAGKSTLLRCIAGATRCAGSILFQGKVLGRHHESRRLIGYLPQHPALLPHATVSEIIHLFAALRRVPPEIRAIPDGFLPDPSARVETLSSGQRHRLAFAVATLGEPKILLLDEPIADLDAQGRSAALDAIQRLARRGAIVLVAAPIAEDVDGLVHRTVMLDEGRICERADQSSYAGARLRGEG